MLLTLAVKSLLKCFKRKKVVSKDKKVVRKYRGL